MHQIFIMSIGIIYVTDLGPVVVQGGRVYFSSLFTHFLLTRITFLMSRLSRKLKLTIKLMKLTFGHKANLE